MIDDFIAERDNRLVSLPPVMSSTLKTWRQALGLSENSMADLCGVTRKSVVGWESETNAKPAHADVVEKIDKLCEVFALLAHSVEEYLDTQEEINESTDIILFRFRNEQAYKKVFPNAPGNVETYHAAISAIYLIYYTQGYNVTVLWDDDPVYSIHAPKKYV